MLFLTFFFLKNILETHGYKSHLQTGLPHLFSKIHVQLTPANCLPSGMAVFTHHLWLCNSTVIAETFTSRLSGWFMTPLTMNTASVGGHPASQRCGRSTGVSLGAVNSNTYGLSKQNCWLSTAWWHDKKQKEQKVGWRSSGSTPRLCKGTVGPISGLTVLPGFASGLHRSPCPHTGQVWIWECFWAQQPGNVSLGACGAAPGSAGRVSAANHLQNAPSPHTNISQHCQPTGPASLLTLLTPYHFQKPENLLKIFISHFFVVICFLTDFYAD